jgi:dolichol kinase
MLAFSVCVIGIFVLLVLTELLYNKKIIRGEYHRKFFHITAGTFIAFWPWLISFRTIQILALLMLGVMVANRYIKVFTYHGKIPRVTYGDIFLALAIFVCATITDNKTFFALAILEVALADGLAAVVGMANGKHWEYKVFGYKKTVVGSMVFWLTSVEILTAGLLGLHSIYSFQDYYYLLLILPPILMIVENLAVLGVDNLLVPVATIVILRLLQA